MRRGALAALVLVSTLAASASAAVPTPQKISIDASADPSGQHETAVEPDSSAVGDQVVSVFQLGRREIGGANGIGFATSRDGGRTWTSGTIPFQLVPGSLDLVSDPAIAYDRVHGTWVATLLGGRAFTQGGDTVTTAALLAARSTDGLSWTTSAIDPRTGHDKNWIACDSGTSSPHAGRCYAVWSAPNGTEIGLGVATSDDGGRTWSAPAVFSAPDVIGAMPLIRPDGTVIVVYATSDSRGQIAAIRSTDGGRSFGAPTRVAVLRAHVVAGLRVPAFPSAEIAADGRIVAAWPDCRFRARCTSSDIVYASSADGEHWTAPLRVPTEAQLAGLDHVLPGLAVDATTAGAKTRLAIAFSVLSPRGCSGAACSFSPFFVSSPDNGRSWSVPERLGAAAPAEWFPSAGGGRFAGDYVSTSFVTGGTAVPVFPWASAAFDGRFHQGIYATAVPPLAARPAVQLGRPRVRVGGLLDVRATAVPRTDARVSCRATIGRRPLRLVAARVAGGIARCTWRATTAGRVAGSLTLIAPEGRATRTFAARLPR
jgi:BNR repeat protein